MKKTLIFAIVFTLLCTLCFAAPMATKYVHYGFWVKCARCEELYEHDKTISKNVAWRTINYKSENGKTYAEYRCQGGHSYWAEIR